MTGHAGLRASARVSVWACLTHCSVLNGRVNGRTVPCEGICQRAPAQRGGSTHAPGLPSGLLLPTATPGRGDHSAAPRGDHQLLTHTPRGATADRPLGSATRRRLGEPLPHQQADRPRALTARYARVTRDAPHKATRDRKAARRVTTSPGGEAPRRGGTFVLPPWGTPSL